MLICLTVNTIGIVDFSSSGGTNNVIQMAISFIVTVLIAVYAFWAYKRPHGNLLRLTMFLFGANLLMHWQSESSGLLDTIASYLDFANGIAAMMIAFVCGRLQELEKNKKAMILTEVILITIDVAACCCIKGGAVISYIPILSDAVCWLALCFAYISRYEEHKAAGLEIK